MIDTVSYGRFLHKYYHISDYTRRAAGWPHPRLGYHVNTYWSPFVVKSSGALTIIEFFKSDIEPMMSDYE